jgi:hypothetical protein
MIFRKSPGCCDMVIQGFEADENFNSGIMQIPRKFAKVPQSGGFLISRSCPETG